MGRSFGLFKAQIPDTQEFKTHFNYEMFGRLRETQFVLRCINTNYAEGFQLWEVQQERKKQEHIIVAVEQEGQSMFVETNEYIIPERLSAYYDASLELFLIAGNTQQRDFCKRQIESHFGQIVIREPEINIRELISLTEQIQSAHISRPGNAKAKRVSFRGAQVERDHYFTSLLEEGAEVTGATVLYTYNNVTHKIYVSENGGVFLIGKYSDPVAELRIIKAFYEDVLKEVMSV